MALNRAYDRADTFQNLTCSRRIRDLQSEVLVQCNDELQRVYRVQPEAVWAEKRLIIRDLVSGHLQHKILYHQGLDPLLQCCCVVHDFQRIPPSTLTSDPVT